jgi:lipopolysaccharide export system protein LptA
MINLKNNKYFFLLSIAFFSNALAEKEDRNKPIEIEANTMMVDDAKNTSKYSGNVVLTQGTLEIKADELIVRQDRQGFHHSTSIGKPTTFKQRIDGSNEYVRGKALRIEYDGHMDKLYLFQNAEVMRGNDLVIGDYITYDASSEIAYAMSNQKNDKKNRTKIIIKPNNE